MRAIQFKPGLVLYASFPDILQDTLSTIDYLRKVALEGFFDLIEVPYIKESSSWLKVQKIAKEAGLELIASGAPIQNRSGWDLSSPAQDERLEAVEGMKRVIDYSYAIGARTLLLVTGKDRSQEERGQAFEASAQSFEDLFSYSQKKATSYSLLLSLEPADRDVAHCKLIGPTKEAVKLVYEVLRRGHILGITLDMSHIAQLGETLEETTSLFGGMVNHAHLSNACIRDPEHPDYGDKHPPFGVLGSEFTLHDGVRFVDLLFERCFSRVQYFPYEKPVISVEIRPAPGSDMDLVYAGTKRAFQSIMHRFSRR